MMNNFLHSGFEFSDNELKLKYFFFNLLLGFNAVVVGIAGFARFYREEFFQGFVDFAYTSAALFIIFAVRRDRKYFTASVYFVMIMSFIIVALSFIANVKTDNYIGLSWFYIEVLVVLFLTNKKFSLYIVAASIIFILSTMYVQMGIEGIKLIGFGLVPFLIFSLFMGLYDKRNSQQTDLLRAQNELLEAYSYRLENYDVITTLPNRNLFAASLSKTIEMNPEQEFTILKIDLDDFKTINDTYGHSFGDKILLEISMRLKNILRIENDLSKVGIDEFIIIIYCVATDELIKIAQKIQNELKNEMMIHNKSIFITCSIGLAIYPKDGNSTETLIQNADSALHNAKKSGRNCFRFYNTDLTRLLDTKLSLIADLKRAITHNELEVYYQPQIDSTKNKLVGMEALIRWNHPTKGFIPPDKFILVAEEYGLIEDIDSFVMKTALKQFKSWKQEYPNIGKLALNLSVKLLENNKYVDDLKKIIKKLDCNPKYLELEITEGSIMNDVKKSIEVLKSIHALGVEIAMDDFGTGYSSLSYLQRLSVDKLKIDRSFIINIPEDIDGANLVKSIIHITKSLNLRVIAEGVENISQKEFLLENGCNDIQGYLYSKPLSRDDMFHFIQENQKQDE
ncbi:EAL domain-containing protein [bacterium]|nr:EAL domain-containing protein [bacterium]MBU1993768.1 EAL domain-containing protein [bacterium]